MRLFSTFVFASALVLAACGQSATTAAPETAEPTQAVAGKPSDSGAPAPAASSGTVSPHMLIGRWGDNGDCTKDIVFAPNGTFRSYTGGTGQWTLDNDLMTMSGANGTYQVRVAVIDGNTLQVFNPDGSVGSSQRCP